MLEVVKRLIKKDKPFIIIKYGVFAIGYCMSAYELITLNNDKLSYKTLSREDAHNIIQCFNLPMLHKMDSHNIVWGDKRFKEIYKDRKIEIL
jgi:hypothetical protein